MLELSIVMPVYNEGADVIPYLDTLINNVSGSYEILVVHDMPEDTTVPVLAHYDANVVKPTLNTYGRGPANAIRFGLDAAASDVVVVTMADGSDNAAQIPQLASLIRDGNVIAVASRYMKGGRQIGGPRMKKFLSRTAGLTLFHLARVGTHDATSSFKAYSKSFVQEVGVESDAGFEIAIELVAKARRRRLPIAEIPTEWHDRTDGESRFDVIGWLPKYLRWYVYAFGPKLDQSRRGTE